MAIECHVLQSPVLMCSVYVIGAEKGPVKIGIATDLGSRLASLQIGNHARLFVHHHVETDHAQSVEELVHKKLYKNRLMGEWFAVSKTVAFKAIKAIASAVEAGQALPTGWTAKDMEAWRTRLGWPVGRAAFAVSLTRTAYKRMEDGSRPIPVAVESACKGEEIINGDNQQRECVELQRQGVIAASFNEWTYNEPGKGVRTATRLLKRMHAGSGRAGSLSLPGSRY